MKKEEIYLGDWLRMFVGEVPGSFYVELLIRVFAIYLLLMVSMRLMGKRMASQLSRNELAALVSLAAAIGVPILSPERGILPAFVIALVVVVIERLVSHWAARNERFEAFSQDKLATLVTDGVMQLDAMRDTRITRERLFAQLRASGLLHLGGVRRLYLEASGAFTLIEQDEPRPGLPIIPVWDRAFLESRTRPAEQYVCERCGQPQTGPARNACPTCGHNHWLTAVQDR